MKKIIVVILALIAAINVDAQKTVKFQINHMLGSDTFALNKASINNIGTNFKVNRLEYYISEISVIHDGGTETKVSDFWILENAANSKQHDLGEMNITTVDSIKFSIGVNPEVNHGDPTAYSLGHPLAPKSPSMHWGWAAGYRFVAIEGKAGIDLNKTFEIHALGDKYYHSLSIPVTATDDNGNFLIELNADYAASLANIDVSKNVITHGDFDEAIVLLKNFWVDVFSSKDGAKNTLDIETIKAEQIAVYPNPSTSGQVNFALELMSNIKTISVYALDGRLIQEYFVDGESLFRVDLNPGLFIVRFSDENGQLISTKKIIIQ